MKARIEATDVLTHLDGVPVRVWKGETETGAKALFFVHRVVPERASEAEFDRALKEMPKPKELTLSQVYDLRLIT